MTFRSTRTASAARLGAFSTAIGCLALALATTVPAAAQDANTVIAKVNGQDIKQSDVAVAEAELGPSLQQMDPVTKRENIISFLIDMKLVAKAAEDKKIGDTPDFKQKLAFTRNRLLMDGLLADAGKSAATDAAEKAVYDDAIKKNGEEQEVHARHILVETEDQAKDIEAELKKGADFAELAKKKSKDPGASDGGDLGFFTKDQMVPEFSAAAFALEPGQVSAPVKTQFGWHVIKVEEKRMRKPPPFEQVKPQVEAFVIRKAQADYVANLRKDAKIERFEKTGTPDAAGPAAAAPAAPDAKAAPAAKKK